MRVALAILILCSALLACTPRTQPETQTPVQTVVNAPVFEFLPGNTSFGKFDPPGTGAIFTLEVGAKVSNPNNVDIDLRAINYQLYLADILADSQELRLEQPLAAGASENLTFSAMIDLSRQPDLIREVALAFSGQQLDIRMTGVATVNTLGRTLRFGPYDIFEGITQTTEQVAPPEIRILEAESDVFVLEGVPVVRLIINASNPGDIGYFLYSNELKLVIVNERLASGNLAPVPISAGETAKAEILFYPDLNNLNNNAQLAFEAALGGINMLFGLEGEFFLDVLGVDTFKVNNEQTILGFVSQQN